MDLMLNYIKKVPRYNLMRSDKDDVKKEGKYNRE